VTFLWTVCDSPVLIARNSKCQSPFQYKLPLQGPQAQSTLDAWLGLTEKPENSISHTETAISTAQDMIPNTRVEKVQFADMGTMKKNRKLQYMKQFSSYAICAM
jgi:hypothetical protein